MNLLELDLQGYFYALLLGGLLAVVIVIIPVQVNSKMRRLRRRRTRAICRICGYRYLRPEARGITTCPHCGVRNK